MSPFLSSPRSGITVSPQPAKPHSLQAIYFQQNTHSFPQRRQPIPLPFNHSRTLSSLTTSFFSICFLHVPTFRPSHVQTFRRMHLSPFSATHPDKLRVLPVFGRSCPPVTPFTATDPQSPSVTPFLATNPKNQGVGGDDRAPNLRSAAASG